MTMRIERGRGWEEAVNLQTRQAALIEPFQDLAEGYRMPIRVLIADDHAIVRLGVRKLIELLGGGEIAVAGEVGDGDGLLGAVEAKTRAG